MKIKRLANTCTISRMRNGFIRARIIATLKSTKSRLCLCRCLWISLAALSAAACSSSHPPMPGPPCNTVSSENTPVQTSNHAPSPAPDTPLTTTMEPPQKTSPAIVLDNLETWFEDVRHATDTDMLENAFRRQNYDPGPDAYALIANIESDHNGQTAYQFYSYRDSAFIFSLTPDGQENFWPASTVKLTAAVMALLRAESLGIHADDPMTFTDLGDEHHTTLRKLVNDAIIPSDNQAYNALMLFTGLDRANDTYIRDMFRFPTMVLQRRYYRKTPADNLRHSPIFIFEHADKIITVPEEVSSHYFEHVPREANATTLVELAEMIRRVMTRQWLPLNEAHFQILQNALLKAPSCIADGVHKAHPDYKIYNKGGRVIGDDRLEIAYITDNAGHPKYLLALSLPYSETVETRTQEFAWQLIQAVDENHLQADFH